MPEYRWKGKDQFGNSVKGVLIADDREQARQRLFAQGIFLSSLNKNWQFFSTLTLEKQAEFLLQFALLLQAEIPLKPALQMLQESCDSTSLYQLIGRCLTALNSGFSLSTALKNEKQFLSEQEWQLLYSGEISAQLAKVMKQLADNKLRQLKLRQQMKKIMFYPLMMLSVSMLLTVLLLLFIVPKFADLYDQQQHALPLITQVLLQSSQFLQNYLWQLLAVFVVGIVVLRWCYLMFPSLRRQLLKLACLVPSIQRLYLQLQQIQFYTILSSMLNSGITLQQSLATFVPQSGYQRSRAATESILAIEAQQCLQSLQAGQRFSSGLSSRFIPYQAKQMIIIGENSGNLVQMLHYLAEQSQQNLSNQVEVFSKLLEPILMLIIGSIIGVVIAGMYLPIFNMGNVVL
ncbi:type II secretion system F family protein [Gallibacterium sp. ZY190522]